MMVRHFLMAVGPGIRNQAIAGDGDADILGDLGDGAIEGDGLGLGGFFGEVLERDIGALRDHQHMHLGLGLDVVEGEDMGVLIDLAAGNLDRKSVV